MRGYWPSSCVCVCLSLCVCVHVCVCLCVCLSHTGIVSKRLNVGSRKQRRVIAQGIMFSCANSRWWATLFPWNLRLKWATPFRKPQFRKISAQSASTVRAGEKRSINTNRKSNMRFPMTHRWTVYVTPTYVPHRVAHSDLTRFCCFCN